MSFLAIQKQLKKIKKHQFTVIVCKIFKISGKHGFNF
eukprot:UN07847